MSSRRALLIGAEYYGKDFKRLPAVRQDVELLAETLRRYDFRVEEAEEEAVCNATLLEKRISDFAESGGQDDVHVIFFSGHGIRVDGKDCLVPAGVSRNQAFRSSNQRVDTDFSSVVHGSATGLVLFIVDACRDRQDTAKGGQQGFGIASQRNVPEAQFIRFFGCAPEDAAHVLKDGHRGKDVSVFTKAIVEALSADDPPKSLQDLLTKTDEQCRRLAQLAEPKLPPQQPRFDHGENSQRIQNLLAKEIFVRNSAVANAQSPFEPSKLHVVVVLSETEEHRAPVWGLPQLVEEALVSEAGDRIWTAFHRCWSERPLLKSGVRPLNHEFVRSAVLLSVIPIARAFESDEMLDQAIRRMVQADLVVFDVTGFEPGVMFLLGVRSSARRGISLCSHGADWTEGRPLQMPFNLQDLSINSHAATSQRIEPNPVVARFVDRIAFGFEQYRHQPRYLDLPAYSSLRQLGSRNEAFSTIPVTQLVLALCPYAEAYFPNWQVVRRVVTKYLSDRKVHTMVRRLVDLGNPQLVSQALYEQIRRVAGCLVDWTDFSPSTFVELGIRLSVSEWGAVQIIDGACLPGKRRAARIKVASKRKGPELRQVRHLQERFHPIPYKLEADASDLVTAAEQLIDRRPDGEPPHTRIHRVVCESIGDVEEASVPIYRELKEAADGLQDPDQVRRGTPRLLFYENDSVKTDGESAALERRLAAWLYLEHRVGAHSLPSDDLRKMAYDDLGKVAAAALYRSGSDGDEELARHIENRLRAP